MGQEEIELERVFNGDHYTVGATAGIGRGCTRIYMKADGNGLSGYYDNIHILFDDGRHVTSPAHHCKEWSLKTEVL